MRERKKNKFFEDKKIKILMKRKQDELNMLLRIEMKN